MQFDPPLDPKIEQAVLVLRSAGVETFESCEGGEGHAYTEPTIRFHGGQADGLSSPLKNLEVVPLLLFLRVGSGCAFGFR